MGKCMLPCVFRHTLRAKTAPPGCLEAVKARLANCCDLIPPETFEVQRHIAEGDASLTLMDVALGIVARLVDLPDANAEELAFVSECLKADRSKTVLPCALIARQNSGDGIGNFLLSTYGDSPKSVVSHAVRGRSHSEDEEAAVSCWPDASLNKGITLELEELFDAQFDTWSFDTFELSRLTHRRPLLFTGWESLRRNACFSDFNIAPAKAQCFLRRIESGYGNDLAIPYHNNLHAADVTQSVHALLGDIGFSAYLDAFSCLTLLLSAMVHDLGHDGRNNTFHANMQDDLALTYNDTSVLENYHVSRAFKLLSNEPDANLLSGLDKEQFACARKQMIEAVLGTDMAHHFSKLSSFKTFVQQLDSDPNSWRAEPEATASLRVMLLHAADISGPTKPVELSDQWAALLTQEFFMQGEEEHRLGMPVSPLCDQRTVKFASSQVGFIKFIVQPTFEALAEVVPQVEVAILEQVHANTALWEERKSRDEEHR